MSSSGSPHAIEHFAPNPAVDAPAPFDVEAIHEEFLHRDLEDRIRFAVSESGKAIPYSPEDVVQHALTSTGRSLEQYGDSKIDDEQFEFRTKFWANGISEEMVPVLARTGHLLRLEYLEVQEDIDKTGSTDAQLLNFRDDALFALTAYDELVNTGLRERHPAIYDKVASLETAYGGGPVVQEGWQPTQILGAVTPPKKGGFEAMKRGREYIMRHKLAAGFMGAMAVAGLVGTGVVIAAKTGDHGHLSTGIHHAVHAHTHPEGRKTPNTGPSAPEHRGPGRGTPGYRQRPVQKAKGRYHAPGDADAISDAIMGTAIAGGIAASVYNGRRSDRKRTAEYATRGTGKRPVRSPDGRITHERSEEEEDVRRLILQDRRSMERETFLKGRYGNPEQRYANEGVVRQIVGRHIHELESEYMEDDIREVIQAVRDQSPRIAQLHEQGQDTVLVPPGDGGRLASYLSVIEGLTRNYVNGRVAGTTRMPMPRVVADAYSLVVARRIAEDKTPQQLYDYLASGE